MTPEKQNRIHYAIEETQQTLDRAKSYSPEVRDNALIAFCEMHLTRLRGMLVLAAPREGPFFYDRSDIAR
jgi:hypothetical protein